MLKVFWEEKENGNTYQLVDDSKNECYRFFKNGVEIDWSYYKSYMYMILYDLIRKDKKAKEC